MATFDLFSAVKDGDTDAVRDQLTKRNCRSKLNERNEWGDTVLHLAAEAGNSDVCQMLIAGGASVTVRNNRGETCLHRAAVGGHTECVRAIVDRDNDPEAINSQNDAGYTALHHSAKHGSIDLIQVLLRSGADRMLENNAGETPYMVARKYQQYDAERLLLNIEQQHADKAIAEMNTKPKKITAAYSKALKYAHKPESRIRLVLVGDAKSGKTSLKKTLFGEEFEPDESSTTGINADPSICRIQFHQYREWVMQPTSQTDGNRLNFEYNDAIIDYILNEIRKPGLSDEVVDLKKLGIRKHKNVNFNSIPLIIPESESLVNSSEISHMTGNSVETEETTESPNTVNDECPSLLVEEDQVTNNDDEVPTDEDSIDATNNDEDDILIQSKRGRQGTIVAQKRDGDDKMVEKANQRNKTKLTFFDSTLEMSKILIDHIPLEVLKRLVVRWPVDEDDATVEQDIANRRRLLISVWDCSGDPIQLSITPLFFSHRCIFLTTYNGTKSLTEPSDSFTSHKLTSLQGTVPTNEEVLEEWIGSLLSQSINLSPSPMTTNGTSPQLPPLIFVTSHGDLDNAKCDSFHQFFMRESYPYFQSHMIDEKPSVLSISNLYESEVDDYKSHHFLRREIDHLARQMPYIYDMIPVQWVRFEQLLFAILEQNKVIILLQDLERYISEMCDISGPLQVQPVLAHFANIGSIVHFHRHPALMIFVVIKPQWLMDALASIFTSSSNSWITDQVKTSFQNLLTEGFIPINNLLLAYRCSRLPPKYWNETLFFMTYMDLIACHPSLHDSKAVYIPTMVNQSPPGFLYGPTANDPCTLFFTTSTTIFPVSLYNQLVVRCIRSSQYRPTIFYEIVHIRLNTTHHLILRREKKQLGVLVQSNTDTFCRNCPQDHNSTKVDLSCLGVSHIVDSEENSFALWKTDHYIPCQTTLEFNDDDDIAYICSQVYLFLLDHLEFLVKCWYPGLSLKCVDEFSNVLDSKWQTNVLKKGLSSDRLAMWFGTLFV